jgi:hypothetical protein
MDSYLLWKNTRYRPILQGFYFNKTNSTQNAPASDVSVFGLDYKMKKATKTEQYCKFHERDGILHFGKNNVSRFNCRANCTL